MELFNEIFEFVLALREEKYPGHTIVDRVQEEYDKVFKSKDKYIGIQLHGKETIILTFMDNNNRFRIGSVVNLEDVQDI